MSKSLKIIKVLLLVGVCNLFAFCFVSLVIWYFFQLQIDLNFTVSNLVNPIFYFICLSSLSATIAYIFLKYLYLKPLSTVEQHLKYLAQGESKKKFKTTYTNEISDLADAINLLENELQESNVSKNHLNRIIESMADTLVIVVENSRITRINQATTKLLGYVNYELIGQVFTQIIETYAGSDLFLTPEEETTLYLYHSVSDLEKNFLTKEQIKIPVLFSASLIRDDNGNVTGLVCVAQDLSKRKEAERALLEARDQALHLAELRSHFLANMSHEIRTPLNGISGMTELLMDTVLNPEQLDLLDSIKISSESLSDIVNDILDFSKIEAGKLELVNKPFSIRSWFKSILKTMEVLANKKSIEIVGSINSMIPAVILADAARIKQIIINLVGNAIKFTPAQGGIFVYIDLISRDSEFVTLKFSVSDSGIGIEREKLDEIFRPFQQADGSIARQYGGTGLGLSICKALTEQMNGNIEVESICGKGSSFHVVLELGYVEDSDSHIEKYNMICNKLQQLKILLVDENETNAKNLKTILNKWSVSVTISKNLEEALVLYDLNKTKNEKFDLIIANLLPDDNPTNCKNQITSKNADDMPAMFLVSSRNSDFQTLHEVDSSTYLILKPVTNSALFDGIIKLALKTDFTQDLVVKPARLRNPTILINDLYLKILVAEDNLINQKLIRALLERRGHQVAIVNNGLQVIEYLEKEIFDLILMDIQMPSMSGDIATAKIRSANKSYSNIPIIALTAHAMLGDRERYLELGMNDYVTKPIDRNELYRCISEQFKT